MTDARPFALHADVVFDGTSALEDRAVVIEADHIAAVLPCRDLPMGMRWRSLPAGTWLAPGFIDVQVNGGGDVLFNDAPTPDGIAAIVAAHRRFGTTALLPTLISDTHEKMRAARQAVDATRHPSVLGIHFEGPFLSPEKPGVHDPGMLRAPRPEDLDLLAAPARGVTLVTLAPEQVPAGFVSDLVRAGVRVALGHSMASYAQTRAALAAGLTAFTHLFNAMRPLDAREPGPIAAALEDPNAYFGMIVDGFHVAPPMLRLALRGLAKPMLVTDAMPPVGGRKIRFQLYGQEISVEAGRCTRSDGRLAGSALDMATAVGNCVRMLGVPLTDALCFASAHSADFLGLGHQLGRVAPGYRADLVAFEPENLRVLETWVAGRATEEEA